MKRPHLPPNTLSRSARVKAIVLAAVLVAAPAASAEERTGTGATDPELAALETQLKQTRAEARSLQMQLDSLNDVIVEARARYRALTRQLRAVRSGVDVSEREYAALLEQFDALVRDAYKEGGTGAVAAVMTASSQDELNERLNMLMTLADGQLDLAERTELMRQSLERQRELTQQLMSEQEAALQEIREQQQQTILRSEQLATAIADFEAARNELIQAALNARKELGSADYERLQRAFKGAKSVTYGQWARLLAVKLGGRPCRENLIALVAWQLNEGTDAEWNPLATTYDMPGATEFNWVGVKNYRSLAQGLQATWLTLKRGWSAYGYGEIVKAVRRCAPAEETAEAINRSSWCYGCTSGQYVTGLIQQVRRNFTFYSKF